jgi:hypothetical protein
VTSNRTAALLLAAATGLLVGCAGEGVRPAGGPENTAGAVSAPPAAPAEPVNPVHSGYGGRFRVEATVLESADHGPQLCQAVADSYPPQCGGPDITGWSWRAVPHEAASGTRWGDYLMVGTFDGERFALTEPAKLSADGPSRTPAATPSEFASPCPEPAGGWRPVDPTRATEAALQEVAAVARTSPDFGGLWVDQDIPASDRPANDPTRLVVNVRFTRNLADREAELRRVWGGALCVSPARHTEAELLAIQQELTTLPGVHSSSADVVGNRIDLGVWVAKVDWQAELDARYGSGVVRLVGTLEPAD